MSYNAVSAAQLRRRNLGLTADEAVAYKEKRHFLDFANKVPLPLQAQFLNDPARFAATRLPVPGLLIKPGEVNKFEEINMTKSDFSQYMAYDKLAERDEWDFELFPSQAYARGGFIDGIHQGMVDGTIESLGVVDYKTTRHRYLKDTSREQNNRTLLGGAGTNKFIRTGDVFDVEHWQDAMGRDMYRVLNRTTEASRLQSRGIAVDWANGIPTIGGGGHKKKYSGKKRGRKPKKAAAVASA